MSALATALGTPSPAPPGRDLADRIERDTAWAHPVAAAPVEPRAAVMDDDQWIAFKRMLARQARERRKANRLRRAERG